MKNQTKPTHTSEYRAAIPEAPKPLSVKEKAGAFVVQDADGHDMTHIIGKQDADLFAAAPELLAVLKDALRDRATWIADRQDALSLAMIAAIAKAEDRHTIRELKDAAAEDRADYQKEDPHGY